MFPPHLKKTAKRHSSTAGFSLTESAVVMGLLGLVLGAIWVGVSQVIANNKLQKTVQQVQTIGANITAIYQEQGGVVDEGGDSLDVALDQLKAFPLEMRQDQSIAAGIIFHQWSSKRNGGNGNVSVIADDCNGGPGVLGQPQPCFSVSFYYIPQDACIKLITQSQALSASLSLLWVGHILVGSNHSGPGNPPFPVTASRAQSSCTNADGSGTNTITWIFTTR